MTVTHSQASQKAARDNPVLVALPIAANVLFWASVCLFAALRPDYSHLTKAVSELGVIGAPRMWAFNVLGYILPGVLIAVFGWRFGRIAAPGKLGLPLCLACPGVGLLMAGVFPGDMRHLRSLTSVLHIAGSFLGLTWLAAMVLVILATRDRWRDLARGSALGLTVFVAVFSLYGIPRVFPYPGLVQRLTFGVWLGWYVAASLFLMARKAA